MRVYSVLVPYLTLAILSVLIMPVAASANLLTNPGFEDAGGSYNGWFTFGSGVQVSTPGTDNIFRSGAAASKMFGEFSGCPIPNFDVGGYGQSFTPTVGKMYTLSGYTFISSADAIPGPSTCDGNRLIAKIVFFNAAVGGSEIQSNEIIVGDWDTPLDQWNYFTVSSPAPAGAMRVEALMLFLQPGCDTGSVFVDDLEFLEGNIDAEPNLLANPSFDSGLAGWNTFGNVFPDARVFAKRTLPVGAKMFSTFTLDNPSGIFQGFDTAPGEAWNFSGYGMSTCQEDPLEPGNDNYVALRLVFRDSGGVDTGASEWTLVSDETPLGTWRRGQVTAVAPAGTDSVFAYVLFISPTLMSGAAFIDDLTLKTVDVTGVPEGRVQNFRLHQNAPNPMRVSTRIAFNLLAEDRVDLKVFDIRGRLVADLFSGALPEGPHSVTWDGTTAKGVRAADGMYRYVLTTSTGRSSRSLLLHK